MTLGSFVLDACVEMWQTVIVQTRWHRVVKPRDVIKDWKISLDDRVVINSGKAKGCVGRIVALDKDRNTVKVQNCNLYTVRDRNGGTGRKLVPRAVHYSNVSLIDPTTDSAARVMLNDKMERVSKKSGTIIPWPRKDVNPTRVNPNATTGPKDTEVEHALEKTFDYHKDVETMKLVRAALSKYNTSI
jgi:ribosomal protein L24